jgi:SAM-dependent methyltransferase
MSEREIPAGPSLRIPPAVLESVVETFGAYFEGINGIDRVTLGDDHVNPARYRANIQALNECVPLAGKKLLEIGAGYGVSLALMIAEFGVDAVGIEPASVGFDASFRGARAILAENGIDPDRIIDASGEALPFPDGAFDVVYSNNVLEHTTDPAKVLSEAVRVLKPGGTLYVEVPNYLSYFEGHYLIPQPPILWRGMLPWWVKWVFGRDPAFSRTLRTEINPPWVRKTLRRIHRTFPIAIRTLGEERFLSRLAQPFVFQTEAVRGAAHTGVRLLQSINWKNWIGRLIVLAQGHYPIVLVATRT